MSANVRLRSDSGHANNLTTTIRIYFLTTTRSYSKSRHPRSIRGVSGDSPEGGARLGVPRLRLVTAVSGGAETARRALRPVLRGARCTHLRRQCRRRKRGPEAENRQGGD